MTPTINLEGKVILMAEDEETNYLFVNEALKRTNVELIWAKNGEEAVDKIEADLPICLVLMDLKMPIMNGYEAIKKIHAYNKEVPIVVQTAYSIDDQKTKFLKMENVTYLPKPFTARELIGTISKLITV